MDAIIPPEIWSLIFENLDDSVSVINLSKVCTFFYNLSKSRVLKIKHEWYKTHVKELVNDKDTETLSWLISNSYNEILRSALFLSCSFNVLSFINPIVINCWIPETERNSCIATAISNGHIMVIAELANHQAFSRLLRNEGWFSLACYRATVYSIKNTHHYTVEFSFIKMFYSNSTYLGISQLIAQDCLHPKVMRYVLSRFNWDNRFSFTQKRQLYKSLLSNTQKRGAQKKLIYKLANRLNYMNKRIV